MIVPNSHPAKIQALASLRLLTVAATAAAATTTDCEVADVEITDCTITDVCSVDDDDFNGASSLLVGSPLGTAILAGAAATAAGRWAPLLLRWV